MELSNDVCLRSERYSIRHRNPKQLLVRTVSFQFLQRIVYSRAYPQKCEESKVSSLVRSLALAPRPPMTDPTHLSVGRLQANTDARDRVGCVHQFLGFQMLGQSEIDSGVATLACIGTHEPRLKHVTTTDETASV